MIRVVTYLWPVVLLLLCQWTAYGAAAVAPTASTTAAASSSRLATALKAVDGAKSLSELTKSLKNLNLSPSEQQQFTDQIKTGPRRKKIDSMYNQTLAQSLDTKPRSDDTHRILAQKRAALAKARTDTLARARASLLAGKATRKAPTVVIRSGSLSPITTQMKATIAAGASGGSNAVITEVSEPVVGQQCTITGQGFGSTRGRVVLLINRGLFYCSVREWERDSIVFTVPADLEEFVGYRPVGHAATVWVKMPGGETGPLQEVTIKPDPATYTPTITGVTPLEITPGQTFVVRGRNFVKYDPSNRPTVRIRFPGGVTETATVEDSASDFVQAVLPDTIGGIERTNCELVLTNDVDVDAETDVRFIPAEEIIAIPSAETLYASCEPRDYIVFCLFGEKVQYTVHDFRLQNGWVVEDTTIGTSDGGPNAGAYFISKPEKGSRNGRTVVEVWADAYSYCYATVNLIIKGPQGVPYQ